MNPQDLYAGAARKPRPSIENIAVRIGEIEINSDGPSFFVGHRLDNNEPVRVRLMTVPEAVDANKRKDANEGDLARLNTYYTEKFSTGTYTRPGAAKFADPSAKEHVQPGGVVLFDRALRNEDGTYRAQWASTIAPAAANEARKVIINLRAYPEDAQHGKKAAVIAHVLNTEAATFLAGDDRLVTLHALLNDTDSKGNRRSPAPVIRVPMADGYIAHTKLQASTFTDVKKNFETGLDVKITKVKAPQDTITDILENVGDYGKSASGKLAKAVLSGITGQEAKWHPATEAANRDMFKALARNIGEGKVQVIAIPGETVFAGNQAAVKMIKDGTNTSSPMGKMLNRTIDETIQRRKTQGPDDAKQSEPLVIHHPAYADAFIGVMRHKETNAPYLRDVFLTSPFPTFQKLSNLQLGPNAKLAEADIVEPGDDLSGAPLDSGLSDGDVNASLAAAANAMDETELTF